MIVSYGTAGENPETLLELFSRYSQDLWPRPRGRVPAGDPLGVGARGACFIAASIAWGGGYALILGILLTWLGLVFQGLYATDISRHNWPRSEAR